MNQQNPDVDCPTCIQDRVLLAANRVSKDGAFSIRDIQYFISIAQGLQLTYKQVRDALYRHPDRSDGQYQHHFNGTYYWL